MENLSTQLEDTKKKLLSSSKEKLVGIATTAFIHNPPFIFGSFRETATTVCATIIIRDVSFLDEIIATFDGVANYFLIDCEVKNEAGTLELLAREKIHKSKVLVYKPNDFTVESLDMFAALLFPTFHDKKVLILGAGNIGSKIALKLCERGAHVVLYGKEYEKIKTITEGLNLIKRSKSDIEAGSVLSASGCDLILGCTPGIPIITKQIIQEMNAEGKCIDVGNGTVEEGAVAAAHVRGIEMLSLSSIGGYTGMIENWLFQRSFLEKKRVRSIEGIPLIVPGVLGAKGDILVDDVENPARIYGVCDGKGGLLPKEEGLTIIETYTKDTDATIQKVCSLYK